MVKELVSLSEKFIHTLSHMTIKEYAKCVILGVGIFAFAVLALKGWLLVLPRPLHSFCICSGSISSGVLTVGGVIAYVWGHRS